MTAATWFKLSCLLFFAAIGILFNYYALYLQRARAYKHRELSIERGFSVKRCV
jgi:hypothetical protein